MVLGHRRCRHLNNMVKQQRSLIYICVYLFSDQSEISCTHESNRRFRNEVYANIFNGSAYHIFKWQPAMPAKMEEW